MTDPTVPGRAIATLGGGCFWCLEAVFDEVDGVLDVVSGYSGGDLASPSYEQVCAGDTGHAEVVQIVFDPARIAYRELLDIFFATHDPTTPNRQGNDVGTQYRSVIFWSDEEQRLTATQALREQDGLHAAAVVTELAPLRRFWPAEDSHRDYFARHGTQPYCQFVIGPKLAKFRSRFANRRKPAV